MSPYSSTGSWGVALAAARASPTTDLSCPGVSAESDEEAWTAFAIQPSSSDLADGRRSSRVMAPGIFLMSQLGTVLVKPRSLGIFFTAPVFRESEQGVANWIVKRESAWASGSKADRVHSRSIDQHITFERVRLCPAHQERPWRLALKGQPDLVRLAIIRQRQRCAYSMVRANCCNVIHVGA